MVKRRQYAQGSTPDSRSANPSLKPRKRKADKQSVAQLVEHPTWNGEVAGAEPAGLTEVMPKPRGHRPISTYTSRTLTDHSRKWLFEHKEEILHEVVYLLHHATNEDKVRADMAKTLLNKLVPDVRDMTKGVDTGQQVLIQINGMPNRGQVSSKQAMAKGTPEWVEGELADEDNQE